MKKLFLLLFISITISGYSQSDKLQLKNGEEKDVILILNNIPSKNDILKYKLLNSKEAFEIQMIEVHKLTLSDGYVLYEDSEPIELPTKIAAIKQEPMGTSGPSDQIIFKNGTVKKVVLVLSDLPTPTSTLSFKTLQNDKLESISMNTVLKLILSDGYVLYEAPEEIPPIKEISKPEKVVVVEEKPTALPSVPALTEPLTNTTSNDSIVLYLKAIQKMYEDSIQAFQYRKQVQCSKEVEELKRKIDYEAVMLYNKISTEIETSRNQYSKASYTMTENLKTKLYDEIEDEINLLKCANTNVKAMITIYVDTAGKVIEFEDNVSSSEQLRNYTTLRENTIYPYLRNYTLPVVDSLYNYSNQINDFFSKNEKLINQTECPEEFDEILSLAKSRFEKIDKSVNSKNTVYTIPISYSFKNMFQTWIHYDRGMQMVNKNGKNTRVNNEKILDEFDELLIGKKKNGRYGVGTCVYKSVNDSVQLSVMHVNRKYIYYVHLGVNVGSIIPLENSDYDLKFGQIVPVEGMLIFHRFGFFGGGAIQVVDPLNKSVIDDGIYLTEKTKYFHGGIYLGLAQYIYLKAGYTHLNRELVEFKNDIEVRRDPLETVPGFMAGLSLVFPVVQFEAGYNHSFKSPYVSAGLNIPINK